MSDDMKQQMQLQQQQQEGTATNKAIMEVETTRTKYGEFAARRASSSRSMLLAKQSNASNEFHRANLRRASGIISSQMKLESYDNELDDINVDINVNDGGNNGSSSNENENGNHSSLSSSSTLLKRTTMMMITQGSVMSHSPRLGSKLKPIDRLSHEMIQNLRIAASIARKKVFNNKTSTFPKSNPIPDLGNDHEITTTNNKLNDNNNNGNSSSFDAPPPTPFHNIDGTNSHPDHRDSGTPDQWIKRHGALERLSGRHPFNAEPRLHDLVGSADKEHFLTPGHLHFVRNHAAVPRLEWETHTIEVVVSSGYDTTTRGETGGGGPPPPPNKLTLTMEELVSLPSRELPVTLTCIGNRRSEQNAIRRTVGFSWGGCAVSTSFFQGVPLRELLLKAGVSSNAKNWEGCHVEFLGSDTLPNKVGPGPFPNEPWPDKVNYGTSIALGKVMDPARDMLVAYKANGEFLPPDHGYPVRIVIPGSTAGRSVKWVKRITVLPHESHNLYHHHDNKILPPHIIDLEQSLEKDKGWWYDPSYIVYELNINSIVARPDHGDTLDIPIHRLNNTATTTMTTNDVNQDEEKKSPDVVNNSNHQQEEKEEEEHLFELGGYAYAGGGRRVNRVEFSLDSGVNWDLTQISRNEKPTPHDMHWCWIFWSTAVPVSKFAECKEILVRAWDETNNTQPFDITWNLMGLGNNNVYRVKVNKQKGTHLNGGKSFLRVSFEHPTQPGGIPGGWMKEEEGLPYSAGYGPLKKPPALEQTIGSGPQVGGRGGEEVKFYSREEVERHNSETDVWIVVDGRIYDCTKYLEKHPGGKESITIYGGKDCTKDFAAVHSLGATTLLEEYYIGNLEGYTGAGIDEDRVKKIKQAKQDDKIRKMLTDLEQSYEADPLVIAGERSLEVLEKEYGTSLLDIGLDKAGALLVSEGWTKILSNFDGFSEALLARWRLLVAMEFCMKKDEESDNDDEILYRVAKIKHDAYSLLKSNKDPLRRCMGMRICFTESLLMGMLDAAIGSMQNGNGHPRAHLFDEQELKSLGMLDGSLEAYAHAFNRCGIQPGHWVWFCKVFLWTVSSHMPDATGADIADLAKPGTEGAYAAIVSHCVARYMIHSNQSLRKEYLNPPYLVLRTIMSALLASDLTAQKFVGRTFFSNLFTNYPYFEDYFKNTNVDFLAGTHAMRATSMIFHSVDNMLKQTGPWRDECLRLDRSHKVHSIPTDLYQIMGGNYLMVLSSLFEEEALARQGGQFSVTKEELEDAFSTLFVDTACETMPTMMYEELVLKDAHNLFAIISDEFKWPNEKCEMRLLQIKEEISRGTGYSHTSEELEAGGRLAWRNSASEASRQAWGDLIVLDKRDVDSNSGTCKLIADHLKAATGAGTDKPRRVLTVMRPKEAEEIWGIRFWTSRYFSYAGYQEANGPIMGDPENLEFTNFLVNHRIWKPPKKKTHFDLLPVVFKHPDARAFAYTIPDDLRYEVKIEHPECKAVADLGLRWPAFDFLSNMSMIVGGIRYQCCSFNQQHVSSEVVRKLSEWPGLVHRWAEAMGVPLSQPLFAKKMEYEMEVAVLHSFKSQGYPIWDGDDASISFSAHCDKEREAGRQCSHVGSFATSEVHRTSPRFGIGCALWNMDLSENIIADAIFQDREEDEDENIVLPNILIVYGSETGTAESIAYRLRHELKPLKSRTVMELNSVIGMNIVKEKSITHVVGICSTFNRGEFPHNAKLFAEAALSSEAVEGVKYAVLAIGSSLYPDFCSAGIRLEQILATAGGRSFLPLNKVDGKNGSTENQIAEWLNSVKSMILPKSLLATIRDSTQEERPVQHRIKWEEEDTVETAHLKKFIWKKSEKDTMICIANDELMECGDIEARSTRRISFRLPPGVSYESGDHLSVQPLNSLEMVQRFALCFKTELVASALEGQACLPGESEESLALRQLLRPFTIECFEGEELVDAQLSFATPTTLSDLLQVHVDLALREFKLAELFVLLKCALYDAEGVLKKDLQETHAEEIQQMEVFHNDLMAEDSDEKNAHISLFLSKYPTVVDFLECFPFLGSILGLANVLHFLPRLQQRAYSISSSPRSDESSVSISVGVVRVTTSAGVLIRGVCSNYLARACPNDRVKVSVRTSTFRGPKDDSYPSIMVGPGTGLAPMMGFLEDRAISLASQPDLIPSDCHLFFGCRTEKDRLYTDQIVKWEAGNMLTFHLALSRSSTTPKAYVQDLMANMGQELYTLLIHPNTSVYLCGDAKVGNAVFETCLEVLRVHGNMSKVNAARHIKIMKVESRWQYDLWGAVKSFDDIGAISKRVKLMHEGSVGHKNMLFLKNT